MKRIRQWQKAYGQVAGFDFPDLPPKHSNVQLARFRHKEECSFCFPHGVDTHNSTISKYQRSWKSYRRTQWKAR